MSDCTVELTWPLDMLLEDLELFPTSILVSQFLGRS